MYVVELHLTDSFCETRVCIVKNAIEKCVKCSLYYIINLILLQFTKILAKNTKNNYVLIFGY